MKKTTTASNPLPAGVQTDRVDRAILRQLQRDASISNVALAEKVNLSPPACLRRVAPSFPPDDSTTPQLPEPTVP